MVLGILIAATLVAGCKTAERKGTPQELRAQSRNGSAMSPTVESAESSQEIGLLLFVGDFSEEEQAEIAESLAAESEGLQLGLGLTGFYSSVSSGLSETRPPGKGLKRKGPGRAALKGLPGADARRAAGAAAPPLPEQRIFDERFFEARDLAVWLRYPDSLAKLLPAGKTSVVNFKDVDPADLADLKMVLLDKAGLTSRIKTEGNISRFYVEGPPARPTAPKPKR